LSLGIDLEYNGWLQAPSKISLTPATEKAGEENSSLNSRKTQLELFNNYALLLLAKAAAAANKRSVTR